MSLDLAVADLLVSSMLNHTILIAVSCTSLFTSSEAFATIFREADKFNTAIATRRLFSKVAPSNGDYILPSRYLGRKHSTHMLHELFRLRLWYLQ